MRGSYVRQMIEFPSATIRAFASTGVAFPAVFAGVAVFPSATIRAFASTQTSGGPVLMTEHVFPRATIRAFASTGANGEVRTAPCRVPKRDHSRIRLHGSRHQGRAPTHQNVPKRDHSRIRL